ncbi:MAG: hypothetical protein GY925_01755 [Actinomycetia bacterium]|nr:hypothetical protein [Actinomycetes bacterium]
MRMILINILRVFPLLVLLVLARNLAKAENLRSVFGEYLDVVTDPAHMLAELTFVLVEALILAPIVGFWVERHARQRRALSNHPGS